MQPRPVAGHPAIEPAVCTTFRWPGVEQGAGANCTRTGMGLRPVAEVAFAVPTVGGLRMDVLGKCPLTKVHQFVV
jgi:hypothetical protein